MLDFIQFDKDKAMIRMTDKEHPDKLWERLEYALLEKYCDNKMLGVKMEQLIACAVNGASSTYQEHFTLKLASWPVGDDPYLLIEELRKLGNKLHTATIKNKMDEKSDLEEHETGLFCMEDTSKAQEKWEKEKESEIKRTQDGEVRNTYQLKGNCHLCKKKEHRRADCYEMKKRTQVKDQRDGSRV